MQLKLTTKSFPSWLKSVNSASVSNSMAKLETKILTKSKTTMTLCKEPMAFDVCMFFGLRKISKAPKKETVQSSGGFFNESINFFLKKFLFGNLL